MNAFYFIVDDFTIQLWKNFGEEILFKLDVGKGDKNKIVCSDYLYNSEENENMIVYADINIGLYLLSVKNECYINFNKNKDTMVEKLELDLFRKKANNFC